MSKRIKQLKDEFVDELSIKDARAILAWEEHLPMFVLNDPTYCRLKKFAEVYTYRRPTKTAKKHEDASMISRVPVETMSSKELQKLMQKGTKVIKVAIHNSDDRFYSMSKGFEIIGSEGKIYEYKITKVEIKGSFKHAVFTLNE